MGYLSIENLYKDQTILMFKEAWAMEKIHGTSAHITFKKNNEGLCQGIFFSGGVPHEDFVKLFDADFLIEIFRAMDLPELTIYGEAYGGKCQKMSTTYGKDLKFAAFDVKICTSWQNVPNAEVIVKSFGLEFVHYDRVETNIETLDNLCSADSVQAVRNGMGAGHIREGIVLRPIMEWHKNNGARVIVKHKNEKFQERMHQPKIKLTSDRLETLIKACDIADEWCTPMRLSHVLDAFPNATIENMNKIIPAMIADIDKESKGEIVNIKKAKTAISKKTVALFKERLKNETSKEI